jgi:hypothetical protein
VKDVGSHPRAPFVTWGSVAPSIVFSFPPKCRALGRGTCQALAAGVYELVIVIQETGVNNGVGLDQRRGRLAVGDSFGHACFLSFGCLRGLSVLS